MLYLLLVITISFMALNLVLHEMDYMHPSFLFSLVFFVYTFMCVINQAAYEIALHWYTVGVIFLGLVAFTFVGAVSKSLRVRYSHSGSTSSWHHVQGYVRKIHISNWIVLGCMLLQLATIYFFKQYLHDMTVAFNATDFAAENGRVSETSLSAQIDLFDTLTKFWTGVYDQMSVPFPILYRLGNPLTTAAAYILIYVVVNNFIADRSINVLHLLSIGLMCVLIVMNGSRSPLFRVITTALILAYILNVRNGSTRIGDRKVLLRIALVVLVAGAGFVMLLNFMGRTDDTSAKLGRYLFIYTGAPIVNLDTYLTKHFTSMTAASYGYLATVNTSVQRVGARTFGSLYQYGAKLLGITLDKIPSITPFAFSANDIEIGNVYTMFSDFVYDFGYGGVLPMTLIVAFYYIHSYDRIMDSEANRDPLDFRLFIYAYLFNDLIMSAFSCRFFQTALDAPFIKLLLVSWLYDVILFRRRLHFGRFAVELTETNYRDAHKKFT